MRAAGPLRRRRSAAATGASSTAPIAIAGAAKRSDAPVASCATDVAYPKGSARNSSADANAAQPSRGSRRDSSGPANAAQSASSPNGDAASVTRATSASAGRPCATMVDAKTLATAVLWGAMAAPRQRIASCSSQIATPLAAVSHSRSGALRAISAIAAKSQPCGLINAVTASVRTALASATRRAHHRLSNQNAASQTSFCSGGALDRERIDGDDRRRERVGRERRRRERVARPRGNAEAEQCQGSDAGPRHGEGAAHRVEPAGEQFGGGRIPPVARRGGPHGVRLHERGRVRQMVRQRVAVEQRAHELRPRDRREGADQHVRRRQHAPFRSCARNREAIAREREDDAARERRPARRRIERMNETQRERNRDAEDQRVAQPVGEAVTLARPQRRGRCEEPEQPERGRQSRHGRGLHRVRRARRRRARARVPTRSWRRGRARGARAAARVRPRGSCTRCKTDGSPKRRRGHTARADAAPSARRPRRRRLETRPAGAPARARTDERADRAASRARRARPARARVRRTDAMRAWPYCT